jgi:hypothetical protein
LRCAPRHSLARWQRANPDTRIKSDGFGECGLSDVSDVSAAITGPNVEAAPAPAANHGRCHRCRAARRAGLWLAPRVWYLLKVARPIGRRTARGRRALALVSSPRIHNVAVPTSGAFTAAARPQSGQSGAAFSVITACAAKHSAHTGCWNRFSVAVGGFLSSGGKL